MSDTIKEYRGIRGLVAAILKTDTADGITYDTPFPVAGVSELTKDTESSSEPHYYDNIPAIVIDSVGSDTVGVNASAIPLEVVGKLTGQTFDKTTGVLVDEDAVAPYVAIGYITEDTDGKEIYVWRYKGKFSRPGSTHQTKTEGTDANGQELTYTGISTTHKFTSTGKTARAINAPADTCGKNESEFFANVTTHDDIITANPEG